MSKKSEFEQFDNTMERLLAVSHSELQKKLEEEKRAKKKKKKRVTSSSVHASSKVASD